MADRKAPYTGPFPRAKHSHRCQSCGEGSHCYRQQCSTPQLVAQCGICKQREQQSRTGGFSIQRQGKGKSWLA